MTYDEREQLINLINKAKREGILRIYDNKNQYYYIDSASKLGLLVKIKIKQ